MQRRPAQWPGRVALAPLLYLGLLFPGCNRLSGTSPDEPLHPQEARAGRDTGTSRIREGARVYAEYCVGCHGTKGDGKGPAARFLDPSPRDFTKGIFKFAAVPSGQLPRDEDLFRTLRHGLPGSSMPAWQFLSEQERLAVIAYIKTLSPAWVEGSPGTPIAVSDDLYRSDGVEGTRRAVERGRVVYHVLATCWQCHPSYASQVEVSRMATQDNAGVVELRPNAERPEPVTDNWGRPLVPPDFTKRRMKSGSSLQDIYRTIGAGIGGTAMPTWKDGLEEKDLWALAYYVKSLADRRWRRPQVIPSRTQAAPAQRSDPGE